MKSLVTRESLIDLVTRAIVFYNEREEESWKNWLRSVKIDIITFVRFISLRKITMWWSIRVLHGSGWIAKLAAPISVRLRLHGERLPIT